MTQAESAAARSKLIAYSKQFIGSRYASGGIGPDSFDCSGLIFTCSRESIGVQLPRTTKAMYSFSKIIPESEREAGDLVFFKTTSSGEISHVGLYMGNNQFIHAASDGPNTGVIVSSLKENYWKGKYYCTGQFLSPSRDKSLADNAVIATSSSDSGSTSRTESSVLSESSSSGSEKKSSSGGIGSISSYIVDASLGVDWNFLTANYFKLTFRGIDALLHIRYANTKLQPGAGVIFRYDSGTGVFQIPIVLSLSLTDYFRLYAGPVITIGTPYLPGDSDSEIEASIFPGILGVIWQTPSFKAGMTRISFVQDIHYTVFNDTDGSALSAKNSIASGLVFSSGFRVTLPLSSLLK